MASPKKPRKKYRPRPVRADLIGYVKESLTPVAAHTNFILDLRIKNHSALAALTHGEATRAQFDVLIAAVNMTEAFYRLGIGKDYKDEIKAGLDALHTVGVRGATALGGRFVLRAEEMKAINLIMEIHDAQLDVVTMKEMEQAIALVANVVRGKGARPIMQRAAA